jgi:hypothetical protein
MRPIVVGLFCAVLAALLPPTAASAAAIDAGMKAKGMAAAPGLVTAAGLDCQPSAAAQLGQQNDPKTHTSSTIFEIACKDREGFLVIDHAGKAPPDPYTCLEMEGTPAGNLKCSLPENANPAAGLQPIVAKVNTTCQVAKARVLGHSQQGKQTFLEVACQDGDGFIVTASDPLSTTQPVAMQPCLAYAESQNIKCTLTDAAAELARVDQLAAQSGKTCQVKDRRYMLTTQDGMNFYEIACQDGKGYVLQQAAAGNLVKTIDCANADYVGGGCTLTNTRQAQSEEAGLYTRLARAAGFDCAVSKYAPFNVENTGHEVIELACSNRPDGAVAIFAAASSSETGQILPCGRSELAGYRCSLTPQTAAYAALTDDLRKLGKTSCTVSGSRIVGVTPDKKGFIEVACADGNPGFMIAYTVTPLVPTDVTACTIARNIAGGCTLAGNQPRTAASAPAKPPASH